MAYSISIPKTGAPEVLVKSGQEVPDPSAHEVLIRNHASSVNFIDTIIRRGEMPEGMMPELPHVPGVEGAGVVEAVGTEVDNIKVGDRVAWMGAIGAGGYGTHSVIPESYVTRIDDDIDYVKAASIPVNAMTAWHMLVNLGRVREGDTILVHAAAGGVGTMILHIAKFLGIKTIASVSTNKYDYAIEQGADYVIDYRREDIAQRVFEITEGRGVDASLNPIAGESLKTDLEVLAPLGTVVLFGFLAGPATGNFADDLAKHFQKSIAVRVSDIYTYYNQRPKAFHQDMVKVFELLSNGVLNPQITQLSIDEAGEAHRRLEAGETTGKLVLTIT